MNHIATCHTKIRIVQAVKGVGLFIGVIFACIVESAAIGKAAGGRSHKPSMTPSLRCNLCLQAVLQGAGFLFCSPKCEAEYIIVAGGSALRRSLRDLERGVCQLCKLDCLQLVKRLRCGLG